MNSRETPRKKYKKFKVRGLVLSNTGVRGGAQNAMNKLV